MLTNSSNPYQPPGVQNHDPGVLSESQRVSRFIPPILSVSITLVLWVVAAITLSGMTSPRTGMLLWSGTLIASLVVSTLLVNRFWPRRTSAISMGLGYVLFGIVFCLLEGDTSNGTDLFQASIVYCTLITAPVIAGVLTFTQNRIGDLDSVTGTGSI